MLSSFGGGAVKVSLETKTRRTHRDGALNRLSIYHSIETDALPSMVENSDFGGQTSFRDTRVWFQVIPKTKNSEVTNTKDIATRYHIVFRGLDLGFPILH